MPDRSIISREFYLFERDHASRLKEINIDGFNAWQIIKTPLYFGLIGKNIKSANATNGINSSGKLLKTPFLFLKKIGRLSRALFLWFSFRLQSRKRSVFFYTFSGDKLAKLEEGKYFNFLVDGIITREVVKDFIYAEKSQDGDFKEPCYVERDFSVDDFNLFISLHNRFLCKSSDLLPIAEKIAHLLNNYFRQSGVQLEVKAPPIARILFYFRSEYICWKHFLKSVRPSAIISSEKPGTGFLAASKSLNIPFVDIQHGVIEEYEPQYVYDSSWSDVKKQMIIPNVIGVFGSIHRDLLLKKNFWSEKEIVILGSSRVEMNRRIQSTPETLLENTILLPTQWTCFDYTIQVLRGLSVMKLNGLRILLKIHPLEPAQYVEQYQKLSSENEGLITIVNKDMDIYKLIRQVRLVIGFDSAVLLESISLGSPCITLTTPFAPMGIMSIFNTDKLEEAIRPIRFDDFSGLGRLINECMSNRVFYESWANTANELGFELYSAGYYENCRTLIDNIQNN